MKIDEIDKIIQNALNSSFKEIVEGRKIGNMFVTADLGRLEIQPSDFSSSIKRSILPFRLRFGIDERIYDNITVDSYGKFMRIIFNGIDDILENLEDYLNECGGT